DLDDRTVADMAQAWPRIEIIHLMAQFPTHRPRNTLACLYSFARNCACLRMLCIAFDATIALVEVDSANHHFQQHALISLHVEHSPIATPISVARFLSQVFPVLSTICTRWDYAKNSQELEAPAARQVCDQWNEAKTLLNTMR
ncbi:hypothetical protein B0H16DRAFT_1324938, partial [Mycena metata]